MHTFPVGIFFGSFRYRADRVRLLRECFCGVVLDFRHSDDVRTALNIPANEFGSATLRGERDSWANSAYH